MADTGLKVAAHLEEGLRWFVHALDAWISRDSYQMGGGSILAARWHHRHSTDIDLFFDAQTCADVPVDEVIEGFRSLEKQGQIEKLEIHPSRGFSCERIPTPLSFFATEQVSPVRISDEREANTGIGTETSAEILVKKVRARMIRNPRYLPRDAYDFVVAHVEEPEVVEQVFQVLSLEERRILAYDAHRDSIQLTDADRIISPAYPGLLDPLDHLMRYARMAFARELTNQSIIELKRMRGGSSPKA